MKIQILVFIIYIISISSFNLRQTKQRQSYDSYVFSLQWPSGYCKVNDCSINLDSLEKNALTIHGLWPSLKSGKMLQICTHGVRINEDNSELFDLMRKYWPSFKGSSKEFWTHEYNKHGYCMVQENGWDDYEDYFGNALYLYFRDYQNLLKEAFPDYKRRIIYNLDIKEMREKKYGNELYSTVDMSRKKISDISDIKKNYDFMMENKLKTYEQNREIMHYTNKIKKNIENIEEKMIGLLCEVNKYDGN